MTRFSYYLVGILLVLAIQVHGSCMRGALKTSTSRDASGEVQLGLDN